MSEHERALSQQGSVSSPHSRPQSIRSARATSPRRSHRSQSSSHTSELSPLLPRENGDVEASDETAPHTSSAASLLRAFQGKSSGTRRWPSLLALLLLCLVVLLIIVLGFFAPAIVEDYATQAATFEPTSLSIHSFTTTGVRARIQGDFTMRASKVKKKPVRDLGRFGTWIAREVESGESYVEVTLPDYGHVVLGTAVIPRLKVDVRNGHTTHVDFLCDLSPGSVDGIRRIAKDWIDGRLSQLHVLGTASLPLKSGLFSFGEQTISQSLTFANKDIPKIPQYTIHKLNFHDVDLPDSQRGMVADVSVELVNDYPLDFTLPPLGFAILAENCLPSDPYIQLADATTKDLHVKPKENLNVSVSGFVRHLPRAFTQACPGKQDSPLDLLLGSYIHGKDTTVYVRGSDAPSPDTPRWITDLISDITVPVPFPGHRFGHLIRNFSLADVHFGLPNPFAESGTPEAQPHISAKVKALVALPEEINFDISVGRVRADADVFYHGSKLGRLDLRKWQAANSTRIAADKDEGPLLAVESSIEDAPLTITDDDLFTEVLQALVFGGKGVILGIKADVDVEMETALGQLAVRKIPAEGSVPIKPINRGGSGSTFSPKVGNLQILDTGRSSLTLSALVNLTNPTEYSATVPYIDINILTNGTLLGHATARSVAIAPGENVNIPVTAVWDPLAMGGEKARAVGVELLSQYISGFNTTLTLRTHEGSIPSQPALGKALARFSVDMPTPSLQTPPQDGGDDGDGDNGDKAPHFIEDATMHLFTSTATFTLLSPLRTSTLYVTYINATAFYHEDEVGHIDYDLPFAVPPGSTISPRLPVEWNLGSVGYDAVKGALGGFGGDDNGADLGLPLASPHSSYIQGKSAPTTPGILGRASSRRQLHGGLSRKLSIYASDTPYAAVEVTPDGTPRSALRPNVDTAMMPKAKSEAALLDSKPPVPHIHAHWAHHPNDPRRHHRRAHTGGRVRVAEGDDWLTRAGLTTSTLLRESKGQSWLVSRNSSASLVDQASDTDDGSEDDGGDAAARLSFSSHQRLHFADDEFSPETPRVTSMWGSRFGSRAPSARNSRRGSRADLQRPLSFAGQRDGYFDDILAVPDDLVGPDFVDADELFGDEDPEAEVARLARERSFGFGGLIDRLVGWSLFSVEEDREASEVEEDGQTRDQRHNASVRERQRQLALSSNDSKDHDRGETALRPRPTAQEEGGWQDAAWLLSVASKVLL
ncbi:hypothetical protein MBLNU459_g5626t1 [Dothideomycetes sp. NU459]